MTGSIRNSVATFVLNVHSNNLFQNYNFRNCDYYNNLQVSGPLSSTSCHIISVSSIPNTGVFTLASHHISTFYPTVSIVNFFFLCEYFSLRLTVIIPPMIFTHLCIMASHCAIGRASQNDITVSISVWGCNSDPVHRLTHCVV